MTDDQPPARVDALLVAGGRYHDIDYARRELLALLAEHDHVRVTVESTFENTNVLDDVSVLVSYTCDVRPSESAQDAIRTWIEGGGRWIALHGTNAALDLPRPTVWRRRAASRSGPTPSARSSSPTHRSSPIEWIGATTITGWWPASTRSRPTMSSNLLELHDEDRLQPLLHTTWQGAATGFAEADWTGGPERHLVQYLRPLGDGAVLYNTLGHCRGHWDMAPLADYYPIVERCSWEKPEYHELLRRAIRWSLGAQS